MMKLYFVGENAKRLQARMSHPDMVYVPGELRIQGCPFGIVGNGRSADGLKAISDNPGLVALSSNAPEIDVKQKVLVGADSTGGNIFGMNELYGMGMHEAADSIMSTARNWDSVYISVSLSVLDAAFAPGVGVAGGLSPRQLLYLLSRLKRLRNLKAFELVDYDHDKDFHDLGLNNAVKIIQEFLH
ncbi:MAG: arginase family protein [Nanoarchaeota archaeon]|nr:arginase family protein [Nanoarchaeota archaeon]